MAIRDEMFKFLRDWVGAPSRASTVGELEAIARADTYYPPARNLQLEVLQGLQQGTLVEVPVYRHDHKVDPPLYRAGANTYETVLVRGKLTGRSGEFHLLELPPIRGYGYAVTLKAEEPAIRVHHAYQARTVGYAWGRRGGKKVVLEHRTTAFHSHTGPVPRGTWLPLVNGDDIIGLLALRAEETRYRCRTGIFETCHYPMVATPPSPSGWVLAVRSRQMYLLVLPDRNDDGRGG